MTPQYEALRNIFIQSSLTDVLMEQKVKSLGKDFMFSGDLSFWFWRYVFAKDVTKKNLTNKLLKAGFDNLTTIEIIDGLNSTRKMVKEVLNDAKRDV